MPKYLMLYVISSAIEVYSIRDLPGVWMLSNFFILLLLQFLSNSHDNLCTNMQKTVEPVFGTLILKFLVNFLKFYIWTSSLQ